MYYIFTIIHLLFMVPLVLITMNRDHMESDFYYFRTEWPGDWAFLPSAAVREEQDPTSGPFFSMEMLI